MKVMREILVTSTYLSRRQLAFCAGRRVRSPQRSFPAASDVTSGVLCRRMTQRGLRPAATRDGCRRVHCGDADGLVTREYPGRYES